MILKVNLKDKQACIKASRRKPLNSTRKTSGHSLIFRGPGISTFLIHEVHVDSCQTDLVGVFGNPFSNAQDSHVTLIQVASGICT